MKRFHKTICFPSQYNTQLKELTNAFNTKEKYGYTNHAYENLKTRFNLMDILQFLKNRIYFKYQDIFEYYVEGNKIVKVCYKMEYNQYQDLIIVLSNNKSIITIYLNNKRDNHTTLKNELYCTI